MKYDISNSIISYCKAIAKAEKARQLKLENTLKILENNFIDNRKSSNMNDMTKLLKV